MKWAVVLACGFVLALATGACSSSGSEAETERSDAAATAAQTETASSPQPEEVRWALRARAWVAQMLVLADAVDRAVATGRGNLTPRKQELARRAIFTMYKCADRRPGRLASIAPSPPSVRTALINDTLAKACGRLQRASLSASGYLLVDRPFNDIRAERRRWKADIEVARELLEAGEGELAALTSGV